MASLTFNSRGRAPVTINYPDDYVQPDAGAVGIYNFGFNNKVVRLRKSDAESDAPTFNFGNVLNIPTRYSTGGEPVDRTKMGTFSIGGRGGSDPNNPNNRFIGRDATFGGTPLGLIATSGATILGIRYTSQGGNTGRLRFNSSSTGAINITFSRGELSVTLPITITSSTTNHVIGAGSQRNDISNIFGGGITPGTTYDNTAQVTVTLNG